MIGALVFLQFWSFVNRITARFRRLKQPKYLFGAIVGGLWVYFYFFRWLFVPRRRGGAGFGVEGMAWNVETLELVAAFVLFAVILLGWLIPSKRAALRFSEAEASFLFVAPISRRNLIHFKLLRSQVSILFSVLFLVLVSSRFGRGGAVLYHAVEWWLIMVTLSLHSIGASFVRTMLFDRGISNWQRRLGVLLLLGLMAGVVGTWAVRALPPLPTETIPDFPSLARYGHDLLVSGPMPYLLYPFRLMVRPYFAVGLRELLMALWPALLVIAALYAWVIASEVAFEEASLDESKRIAERVAALRTGRRGVEVGRSPVKRPPFQLAAQGPPAMALLWKNLIAAGQAFTFRRWIFLLGIFVAIPLASGGLGSGVRAIGGTISMMLFVFSVIIGPQAFRHDFRQDLSVADILKTYPLSGWQVAFGQLLAPVAVLTAVQWLLIAMFLGFAPSIPELSKSLAIPIALGAALIIPALNFVTLIIPNAAVLLFPAWAHSGKDAPQGIEATGQRLIFGIGQFLVLLVALLLPAAVFAGCFFLGKWTVGLLVAVLVASAAAAAVLAVEAFVGIGFLGRLFERLDLSVEGP